MRNPEERSLYREMQALLHDGSLWIGAEKELRTDLKTFARRFQNEGMGFLTKTLPEFGKAISTALSGNVTFCTNSAFKLGKGSAFPKFLGAALRQIFDNDGMLRDNVDPNLVRWIRTFTMYAYKVEMPFSEEATHQFSVTFASVDEELGAISPESVPQNMLNVMRNHLASILSEYKLGAPADGPGISSDVSRFEKRMNYVPPSKVRNHFGRDFFHQPLEYRGRLGEISLSPFNRRKAITSRDILLRSFLTFFDAFAHCIWNPELLRQDLNWYSKVIFVPKDSRGPRVIACEPSAHMFAQQAVRNGVYEAVENSPLTRGRVNFRDQTVNQKATFDTTMATLDLKEASDRVSYSLVANLFPRKLFADMDACRTEVAQLPDKSTVVLNKFAPMGSALCFPTMALLAYTSVCSAIYLAGGSLPSRQTRVFVYGDDIIVPNEWAHVAIAGLETVGLLVNTNKSFINSRFRESCGQDTFDHSSGPANSSTVTPLRRRKLPHGKLMRGARGSKIVAGDGGYAKHSCAVMNQAVDLGFLNLAIQIEEELSTYLRSPIPFGTAESSYICHIVSNSDVAWDLNEKRGYLHKGKLRAYVFRDSAEQNKHTPYSRLRSGFFGQVCPITGDNKPGYLETGLRSPVLQIRTLKKWWIGAFV